MSALTDRLTEEDFRELARLLRETHTRCAAKHERQRLAAGQGPCPCPVCTWVRASQGDHGAG